MRRKRRKEREEDNYSRPTILYGYEGKKKELLLERNFNALENLLKELLSEISHRIQFKKINQEISELALKATILLDDLKSEIKISLSTYEVILLPRKIIELEQIADNFGRTIEFEDEEKKLDRIESIISFLIRLFDSFSNDYPNNVVIPSSYDLDFLLSIENDFDFKILLIALSKTRNKIVFDKLKEFEVDDEYEVVKIAKMLLKDFYQSDDKTIKINKDRLNELVSQDKIEDALKELKQIANDNSYSALYNEVVSQLGRISQLNSDIRKGFINTEDTAIARNKIRMAIIELINNEHLSFI